MNLTLTDEIYKASRDPRIVALSQIIDVGQKESIASDLNDAGLIIDRPIDIWGWDPVFTMVYRQQLGYPWVPNAFQPSLVNPFKLGSGPSTDMSKQWPRSITVSTDADNYPPHDPALIAPKRPMVTDAPTGQGGFQLNTDLVTENGKWLFQNGQSFTDPFDGKKWVFHSMSTPFGPQVFATAAI
jgi:hypothetical protein